MLNRIVIAAVAFVLLGMGSAMAQTIPALHPESALVNAQGAVLRGATLLKDAGVARSTCMTDSCRADYDKHIVSILELTQAALQYRLAESRGDIEAVNRAYPAWKGAYTRFNASREYVNRTYASHGTVGFGSK